MSSRIELVNRDLRPGTRYQQCFNIEGNKQLNFCLKPTSDYSEMDLFIHDNSSEKKYVGKYDKIRHSDSFRCLQTTWGEIAKSSGKILFKERRAFTSWKDLEYARKAGECLAQFIAVVKNFV